ncbi:MAG: DUF6263 family protein [Bacteroidia bacterium]
MKNIFSIILSFLVIFTLQAQKLDLKLNLKQGETYYQKMNTNMNIDQTINGMANNITMSIRGVTEFKVTNKTDSFYFMDVVYASLAMDMKMPMATMSFDSEKKDSTDIFSKILRNLIGKSMQIKMDYKGKVFYVKNADSIFNGMFENIPNLPESQRKQLEDQMKQSYGEEAFRNSIEMSVSLFPEKPVALKETWEKNSDIKTTMELNLKSKYKLEESNKNFYRITGSTEMSSNKDKYVSVSGFSMKYDMNGTMTSDVKIDTNTGWVIESNISQNLDGNVDIEASDSLPDGLSFPMKMKSEIKLSN